MRITICLAALAGAVALAGCVPTPKPEPRPAPHPMPAPPPPPPRPAPPATEWQDLPLTPGDWRYAQGPSGSEAVFAIAGAGPAFFVRCDQAARRVQLVRAAGGGSQLRIRTSYGARAFPGTPEGAGVGASLPANDPFLDSMAFSRGRFTVESDSGAMLVIPAWPEPARVIEDCRG